jgi:hypothetical protein
MGHVRFKICQSHYDASVTAIRNALGDKDFEEAGAEGAALSTKETEPYRMAV